ncbi:MAG: IclR family transcriptional regulator [Desulfuromonas sp.]|nr:MAG: IclR family transcriptional regulator [Desulfuromonas sp.]
MPGRDKDTYCIQSVENALTLLEALCEEEEEVSLSRLSERLGMNKANVFRLLATFESRGYVERSQISSKYRLGPSAYEIGQKFLSRMDLLRKARSVMEQLVRECNESIYLVVPCGREVLFLYVTDSIQQVKVASLVGRRFPLESSAAGQVIRAFDVSSGAAGAGNLEAIRRAGIARDEDALGEGIASLAVPLIRGGSKVAGALVMLWPDFRVPGEGVDRQFVPALKMAGEIVSARLGYRGYENSIGARSQAVS